MSEYARVVRAQLPSELFERRPERLWWLALHGAVILATATFVLYVAPPCYVALLCGLIIGHSWGCLGFLAHETLHHAVVERRWLELVVGYLAFLPFCLSPTLWVVWHNQTHHAYTGHLLGDPDHFATLHAWQRNRYLRHLEALSPGSGNARSAAFLLIGFTLQAMLILLLQSDLKRFYRRISRRRVYFETVAMAVPWLLLLYFAGIWHFVFLAIIPMLTANTVLMSYIATNHYLNPLTSTNDPLANSLSVRSLRWIEALHLQFGYHVEHHIFPAMSAKHAPAVRDVLERVYGSRYLSLPHLEGIRLLYTRPKLHLTSDTLVNPRTKAVFQTLGPSSLTMPHSTTSIAP